MNFLESLLKKKDEEEVAVPFAPGAAPQAPQAAPAPAGTHELTAPELLEPYLQPRPTDFVAPKIQIPQANNQDQAASELALEKKLTDLKSQYEAAQEDARSRQMKAEMVAALGNNINQMVAGAQAMNTKASVTPAQSHKINVGDAVAKVDARFNKDYDNLLQQYKTLKGEKLSPKDILYANIAQAQLDMGAKRANDNIANTDRNAGMRAANAMLADQKNNELSDKQTESIVGFDKTHGLLSEIESKVTSGKFDKYLGPFASKAEGMKEFNPLGEGMDPEFAKFQSDVTDSLSQYIKSLSGLTVSDKERIALETSMPKVGDKPRTFLAKLQATKNRLEEYEAAEKAALSKYQGKNVGGYSNPKDQQALEWANKNPKDPRAAAILKKLGK
jgi:hypothetical protein